jgi:cytochrome c oxidase assembly factor CtaG
MTAAANRAALLLGVLGGPIAWSLHLLVSYPLVPLACRRGSDLPLHLVTAVTAALALASGVLAWRAGRGARGRDRFMADAGFLLSAGFLVAVLAGGLPVLLQDPCDAPMQGAVRTAAAPLLALLAPAEAFAHDVAGPSASATLVWNFDPWTLVALGGFGLAWIRGVHAIRRRRRGHVGAASPLRRVAATIGLVALTVALVSPLDALSDALFSAHMVQHLLLMAVAAPLLVFARVDDALLWSLPPAWRRALGGLRARPPLRALRRTLAHPATAWLAAAAALWLWHAPPLYQAALDDGVVHALEHASFFATAALFWRVVARAGDPDGLGHGAAILYVFFAGMQSAALGALITFATVAWYPAHAAGAAAWGLSTLEDQQLAGVVMWAPAGLVYVGAALALFAAWLGVAERRVRRCQATLALRTVPLPVGGAAAGGAAPAHAEGGAGSGDARRP